MAVVLITGASSGIGKETAALLASQGHKVYGAARRVNLIEEVPGVVPVKLDITDEESTRECVDFVMKEEGRIDVLVNNAGYGYFGAIETVPLEDARNQLEVNVFGLARLTKMVLPVMREQGGGRIVNISSVAGKITLYFGGWYNVSKFAVEAFSDALRAEVKPFGIDVVLIEPGSIKTGWGAIAADHLEESSKGTAYEKPALNEAFAMKKLYGVNLISSPSVVSKAISRAVNSRHPRVRYRPGTGAHAMLFFHAILPAKWWDSLVRMLGHDKVRKMASKLK